MKNWFIISLLLLIPVKQTFSDETSLIKAAEMGNISAVRGYLEKGMSIESRDHDGKTALIAASQYGHTAIVKLLLDKGAAVNAKASHEITAFYYAAQNHHIDSLKLLHARGADINIINQNQFSPLSVAIINRDEEVVRLLLDFGADPNSKPTGQPLLTEALVRSNTEIVQVLIAKGANVNATQDQSGDTPPLMIAVGMHRIPAVKLLLSRGANIKAKDANNKNVLHWLLCNTFLDKENIPLLELLLKNGAEINEQARSLLGFKDGSTPIMCAVRRDFQKSVNLLLAKKTNLNQKDEAGHTALFYAVEERNSAMVKALLAHGADPTQEDELVREARIRTEIGEMLLAALQPSLEAKPGKCPEYKQKYVSNVKHHQPVIKLDPLKIQSFPVANVEVIDAIPTVGDRFSLSPDGKWLVVRENNKKTPEESSQRLVVFDIAKQQSYFFPLKSKYYVAEDRWVLDSSYYVLGGGKQMIVDVSNGQPQLRLLSKPLPHSEKLISGSDPCPWRNSEGKIILSRPDREYRSLAWSTDGKVVYSLQDAGNDKYYLVSQRGMKVKELIRHSAKWLRENDPFYLEMEKEKAKRAVSADELAKFEEFKAMLLKMPLQKLSASNFSLSPNDRYLYYRLGQAGGSGFFGLPDSHIVVDLNADPLRVWYINRTPLGNPQWHPNGRDLYFIEQIKTEQPDPNFPPMRQPGRMGVSVAYFP